MRTVTLLCAAVALLFPLKAVADAPRLYGAGAPEDAAFVRFVNATDRRIENVRVGGTEFEGFSPEEATSYRPVTPGIYMVQAHGHREELIAGTQRYYTMIVEPEAVTVIHDQTHEDAMRAQLVLYNLSSLEGLSLRTADGRTVVVEATEPGRAETVAVNPVQVSLALYDDEEPTGKLGPVRLESGQSYSVFVFGDASRVLFEQATITTE